jgi:hypothetical protein
MGSRSRRKSKVTAALDEGPSEAAARASPLLTTEADGIGSCERYTAISNGTENRMVLKQDPCRPAEPKAMACSSILRRSAKDSHS